jgi:hypothetical protein
MTNKQDIGSPISMLVNFMESQKTLFEPGLTMIKLSEMNTEELINFWNTANNEQQIW